MMPGRRAARHWCFRRGRGPPPEACPIVVGKTGNHTRLGPDGPGFSPACHPDRSQPLWVGRSTDAPPRSVTTSQKGRRWSPHRIWQIIVDRTGGTPGSVVPDAAPRGCDELWAMGQRPRDRPPPRSRNPGPSHVPKVRRLVNSAWVWPSRAAARVCPTTGSAVARPRWCMAEFEYTPLVPALY